MMQAGEPFDSELRSGPTMPTSSVPRTVPMRCEEYAGFWQ